ncbi:MAG: hypothetical protein PHC99_06880 [Methylococcales bacterium]|nr:hypothetical protein [Methylococcales bacterium]
MNKNREIKIAEKENFASVDSTHKQTQNQPVQDTLPERVFVMPSVPRPGVTSWSLVL